VPRNSDRTLKVGLQTAQAEGRMLLIVGGSAGGKSRSAAEAARTLFGDYWLLCPRPTSLARLRELQIADLSPALVWLDDAERYDERAFRDTIDWLLRSRVTVIATIRRTEHQARMAKADFRYALGEALADKELVVEVPWPVIWTDQERALVGQHISYPPLLHAVAAGKSPSAWVVAGPALEDRLRDAEADDEWPTRYALLRAVLDWYRTGIAQPIPKSVATSLLQAYLTNQAKPTDIEDAFRWALESVLGSARTTSQSLLSETSTGDAFTVNDYIQDADARTARKAVPDGVWAEALRHATTDDARFAVGQAAGLQGNANVASQAFLPLASKRPDAPSLNLINSLEEFHFALKALRARAGGPSLGELSDRTERDGRVLGRDALADAFTRTDRLPAFNIVEAIAIACGVSPDEIQDWRSAWDRVALLQQSAPYRGLAAFEERDAAFFFGREEATMQVLARMSQQMDGDGLLIVSGVSGAGKSSLLRAGVLPRLRRAGLADAPWAASWSYLVFTPGRAPLDELAVRVALLAAADAATVRQELDANPVGFASTARRAALTQQGRSARNQEPPEPEQRLLLVVDQFEQLFTQCPDEAERQAFITALHAAATARQGPDQAPAAFVMLGVRADFEARCADYPQLAGAVQNRYLVTSMTDRQLRMAITEPARQVGSNVDDGLVEVLLHEVSTRQSASSPTVSRGPLSGAGLLPLLSHALDQAWRHRAGEVLTLADYERASGIEGAVADSAQRTYDHLTPGQQAAARRVFVRLTATTSDGIDTAARSSRAELSEGQSPAQARDLEAVLEAFATERLLTIAADTVAISHEVLLTAWPLLRDTWLAETHADRIVRTRLHNAAAEWNDSSRDSSYLYRGSLLEVAAGTAARISADTSRNPPLTQSELSFLNASDRAHRRSVHRRQSVIAILVIMIIITCVAVIVALNEASKGHQRAIMPSETHGSISL
jgi:hypothetical protein